MTALAAPLTTPARRPGTSARGRRRPRSSWHGLAFFAPTLVFLILFFVVPIILVLMMSGSKWSLLAGAQGGNLPDNYANVVADPMLGQSIWFTLKYTFWTTILLMPIALALALLVQESRKWNTLLRTAILLPTALGLPSASLLFYALYSPQIGPVNPILAKLGLMDVSSSVLGTPNGALWATIILIVWRFTGYYMLLNLVGIQAIPNDLYEAAKLDGANRWQTLRRITLPLLRPTIAMTMIMSISGSLLAFDQFYILTKGGPNNSTMTIVLLIYKYAFETKRDLGMAAALSVLVLIVLVLVNVAQLRALRSPDEEK